jgi:hypothetical protein
VGSAYLEEVLWIPSAALARRPRRVRHRDPLIGLLRAGNAGSSTAADHIAVLDEALAQLLADVTAPDAEGNREILAA